MMCWDTPPRQPAEVRRLLRAREPTRKSPPVTGYRSTLRFVNGRGRLAADIGCMPGLQRSADLVTVHGLHISKARELARSEASSRFRTAHFYLAQPQASLGCPEMDVLSSEC